MSADTCESFSLKWDADHILHNLSICCNCTGGTLITPVTYEVHLPCLTDLKHDEGSFLTFSVQLTRTMVTLMLLLMLLLCYST